VNKSLSESEQEILSGLSVRRIVLSGQVQGVGFRPFIYRIATEHQLTGWVRNCVGVVEIHVQGPSHNLDQFVADIFAKKPPLAVPVLESIQSSDLGDYAAFEILPSVTQGAARISVPADLFLCDDCLAELNNPADRRYRYPFINCTQCGPRYTLIHRLPYDRRNTTMAAFELCPQCRAEYENPRDRRFHAEPVACPVCGPSLEYHERDVIVQDNETALSHAVKALQQGKVVAVKGIGGYHLMCDATSAEAVSRLRQHKPRPHKPLAVMFPAPVENPFRFVDACVALTEKDKEFLIQPARPILLVAKKSASNLAEQIAPGLNEIGVMLPYSPLHHLLLNALGKPLVATSANLSGEPVLTENHDVESRLAHVADACLHHNRPIERPADDPVYRNIAGAPRPIRIGRGVSPLEVLLPFELKHPVLAVGAHMKNTVTLAWNNRVVVSPHIGEMNTARSIEVFENTIRDLQNLYGVTAEIILCDAHPSYTTTRWAKKQSLPVRAVHHHHAHASAAYVECNTQDNIIVFAWDGVGYGEDGTLWGGETFVGKPGIWQRVASMRTFHLPGGDKASREPWRSAAALSWELGLDYDGVSENDNLLYQAWQKKLNAPQTSAVGRLFDAAAALCGVRTQASYEGQAAMELEALCGNPDYVSQDFVDLALEHTGDLFITDWQNLIPVMRDKNRPVHERAMLFHASLAQAMLKQALAIRETHKLNHISFCGGVFQNRVLTDMAIKLFTEHQFMVHVPQRIPLNDAGISFGQVLEYGFNLQLTG
jgi:hydrogenase maturation protein HypF